MLDEIDNLEWLEGWYRRQCDGLWEHMLGLRLEPLPGDGGWRLTIELAGTDLTGAATGNQPRRLALETRDGGWLDCSMSSERFTGSGDLRRVEAIIGVFRRWVDAVPAHALPELEAAAAG